MGNVKVTLGHVEVTVGYGGERWVTVGNGGERWVTVGNGGYGGERWGHVE